jgi:hypothetical protein
MRRAAGRKRRVQPYASAGGEVERGVSVCVICVEGGGRGERKGEGIVRWMRATSCHPPLRRRPLPPPPPTPPHPHPLRRTRVAEAGREEEIEAEREGHERHHRDHEPGQRAVGDAAANELRRARRVREDILRDEDEDRGEDARLRLRREEADRRDGDERGNRAKDEEGEIKQQAIPEEEREEGGRAVLQLERRHLRAEDEEREEEREDAALDGERSDRAPDFKALDGAERHEHEPAVEPRQP